MKLVNLVKSLSVKKTVTIAGLFAVLVGSILYIALSNNQTTEVDTPNDTQQDQETEPVSEQPSEKQEQQDSEEDNQNNQEEPAPPPSPEEQEDSWPVTLTATEASSLQVVVNKKHKLPSTYVPNLKTVSGAQLRPEAADALGQMLEDAKSQGVNMAVLSSYRSYSTQVNTYNRWVQRSGQEAADTFSARPGHSEHQLGLAVDLGDQNVPSCNLQECFGDTKSGKWLENNAHEYGFIIRYPENKQSITGFIYEPWHLRYVGSEAATSIKNSGLTMDQYYGVEAGGYQ